MSPNYTRLDYIIILSTQNFKTQKNYTGFALKT